MKQMMPAATISQPPTPIQSGLNPRQNINAGHRLMLHQLLFPTHIYGRLKRLYTRRRNANLSERLMMMIMMNIMTMSFSMRTQSVLVEKTQALQEAPILCRKFTSDSFSTHNTVQLRTVIHLSLAIPQYQQIRTAISRLRRTNLEGPKCCGNN